MLLTHSQTKEVTYRASAVGGGSLFLLVWTLCKLRDSHSLALTPIFQPSVSHFHTQTHTHSPSHIRAHHICSCVRVMCVCVCLWLDSVDSSVRRRIQIGDSSCLAVWVMSVQLEPTAPLLSFLQCVPFSLLPCVSLSFPLPGPCRSQAVCSLNRLDLSADSGAASVFNCTCLSVYIIVRRFLWGWVILSAWSHTHWGNGLSSFLCLLNVKFLISNHFVSIRCQPLALNAHVVFNHEFRDNGGSRSTTNPLHNIALIHQGNFNNA